MRDVAFDELLAETEDLLKRWVTLGTSYARTLAAEE